MLQDEFGKLKEKTQHGDFLFQYAEYGTKIPQYFTSFPMHWHDEMEIIWVQEGRYEVNIDLENYLVEGGDFVILKPLTLHSFKQYKKENMETTTILFPIDFLSQNVTDACYVKYFKPLLDSQFTYPLILKPEHSCYEKVLECFGELLKIYAKKEECFELQMKAQLFQLFHTLFSGYFKRKEENSNIKSETIQNIKMVLDYIKENYRNTITVSQLASLLHFSEQYFMRFFKKYTGMTCVDYINDYRLNMATRLLITTDLSVMEIATRVGMNNISYFNRMFKRKYNVTPKDYRKRMDV